MYVLPSLEAFPRLGQPGDGVRSRPPPCRSASRTGGSRPRSRGTSTPTTGLSVSKSLRDADGEDDLLAVLVGGGCDRDGERGEGDEREDDEMLQEFQGRSPSGGRGSGRLSPPGEARSSGGTSEALSRFVRSFDERPFATRTAAARSRPPDRQIRRRPVQRDHRCERRHRRPRHGLARRARAAGGSRDRAHRSDGGATRACRHAARRAGSRGCGCPERRRRAAQARSRSRTGAASRRRSTSPPLTLWDACTTGLSALPSRSSRVSAPRTSSFPSSANATTAGSPRAGSFRSRPRTPHARLPRRQAEPSPRERSAPGRG